MLTSYLDELDGEKLSFMMICEDCGRDHWSDEYCECGSIANFNFVEEEWNEKPLK